MNLKILAVAVSLAFGASLLTACGDSGSPKVTRDTTSPSGSTTTPASPPKAGSGSTSAPASSSSSSSPDKSASGSTSAPASTPPAASGSPTDPEKKKP